MRHASALPFSSISCDSVCYNAQAMDLYEGKARQAAKARSNGFCECDMVGHAHIGRHGYQYNGGGYVVWREHQPHFWHHNNLMVVCQTCYLEIPASQRP